MTVAFNAPELIALQVEAVRQNVADSFVHVIVDNSSSLAAREEIRSVCAGLDVDYVSLPPSHATSGSQSHGLALNWAAANVLKRSRSDYFGFLDHDIFPFVSCSYRDVVAHQNSYGHFQRAGVHRFYWPGLMFFNQRFLALGAFDFQPRWLGRSYGDTGAGNWPSMYARFDDDGLSTMSIEDVHAHDPDRPYVKGTSTNFQSEALTVLDGSWVHLVNGSNWAENPHQSEKLAALESFLRSKVDSVADGN